MLRYKLLQLNKDDIAYQQKFDAFTDEHKRKTAQYISEGITFVFVTLVGAVFVYRAVRRQFRLGKAQQNFMMAVTHELKTPIAVVNLNLETLQKRKLDEGRQQHIIASTLKEAERLNDLTTNILVTSQLESGNYMPDKEKVDMSSLTNKAVSDFMHRFPNRNIRSHIDEDIFITGEKLLLQLLINNLIDNALKYSPKSNPVFVELKKTNEHAQLNVIDDGNGIADNEKRKVFQKFYRSGDEDIRKTKGTGLGLYLCKRIAETHKAKMKVTNNQPTGSIFTFEFKL